MAETLARRRERSGLRGGGDVLPGEAFLADQMAVADVDAIHAVRDAARVAIGGALRDRLRATYDR